MAPCGAIIVTDALNSYLPCGTSPIAASVVTVLLYCLSAAPPLLAGATKPTVAGSRHAALCSRMESDKKARLGRPPSHCFLVVIKGGPGACPGSADCRKPVAAPISFAANYVLAEFLGDNAALQRANASHPRRAER